MTRPFLVFTSAGENANIRQWASSGDRTFDIWVTNYTDIPGLNRPYADHYNERKGGKFPNFKHLFDTRRESLDPYRAIMLMDDDIHIRPQALDTLFALLERRDLWALQPAFSRFGKTSHASTLRRIATTMRYTNFIEVTCPLFRTDKLLEFMAIYDPELICWGVDWWFCSFFGPEIVHRMAIVDDPYCSNPRDLFKPGGRREIDRLHSQQERDEKWAIFRERYGIDSFDIRTFARVPAETSRIARMLPFFLAECLFFEIVNNPIVHGVYRRIRRLRAGR